MNTKNISEDLIADYVEGKCNDAICKEIGEKRQQDPEFDMMVFAHENLLSALKTTPFVTSLPGSKLKPHLLLLWYGLFTCCAK